MDELEIMPFAATISLPPGSNSVALQNAINNAASGDIIEILSDMTFTGSVTIPSEKEITIQSSAGNKWVLTQTSSNNRHFTVNGSLILQNITLDGNNIGGGVNVNNNKSFVMNSGTVIRKCIYAQGGGVYAGLGSSFTLNGGEIYENAATLLGGGVYAYGTFTMTNSKVLRNTSNGIAGGIISASNTAVTISDSVISENTANSHGGGIWLGPNSKNTISRSVISGNKVTTGNGGGMYLNSLVSISDSIINDNETEALGGGICSNYMSIIRITGDSYVTNNKSHGSGGGIYISSNSSFTIQDASISGNTADINGGGIYINSNSSFTIQGTNISGNTANINGGGIYAVRETEITENNHIVNNRAVTGNGGGIFMHDTAYTGLKTGVSTVFGCNRASTAHQPPVDAGTLYPDIRFANVTITEHPLNNFDINYTVGEPINVFFNVTYNANGGTGNNYIGPNIMPCETDIVLSLTATGISHSSYNFKGWNTQPDGKGLFYSPGDEIVLTNDVTLYAQWEVDEYTVNYNANGGTGNYASRVTFAAEYTILALYATGITRSGYTFTGWNVEPDGSGTPYIPDQKIIINGDMTLYAQWVFDAGYTVTYNANGGTGTYANTGLPYANVYTVLDMTATGITRPGYSFKGWNTQRDGTGMPYAPGDKIIINGDVTLYAQWESPLTRDDAINLIIASVAMEELALSHIMNAEGEKLQYVLGTLEGRDPDEFTICDIMEVNDNIQKTMMEVIKTERFLQFKLEDAAELDETSDEE